MNKKDFISQYMQGLQLGVSGVAITLKKNPEGGDAWQDGVIDGRKVRSEAIDRACNTWDIRKHDEG